MGFFSAFCKAALSAAWLRYLKEECWWTPCPWAVLSSLATRGRYKSQQKGLSLRELLKLSGFCCLKQPQGMELPLLEVDSALWWAGIFHLFCVSLTGVWWGESCWAMAFKKAWCALALGFLLPFSCAHTDFFTSIGEACFGVAKRVSWQPSKLILQWCVNHPRP